MTSYSRPKGVVLLVALPILGRALAAGPAPAWDGPTVQEATASLTFQLFVDASPTPICWVVWEEEVSGFPGQVPPLQGDHIEEGEPCNSAWLVRCDADGLAYEGSWPEIDPEFSGWNFQSYTAALIVQLYVPDTTRLLAEREVSGALNPDEHLVSVAPFTGPETELLGVETEDTAEILLEPGGYTVTLAVHALESGTHYAYDASIRVWWEDPELVATARNSWGAVKALYR